MGEWREGKLADVCDSIDYGLTASASDNPAGPKFLRITDIVRNALNWRDVPHVQVSDKDVEKFKLNDGDIVIARTGATTGESRYIIDPPHAVFASYLVRLRINQQNDARFISYWLKSPAFRGYLQGVLGDKSAQPNASASTMTQAPISIPPNPEEQRAIAAILGALDDKIESNRRMNETLEAMARAIFKDWLVDFGPTRAKAEGRAPYLAPEIWDLFPDTIDDEGKPVGWTRENLGTLFDVSIGRTPPRKEQQHFVPGGSGVTWLSIKAMRNIQTFALGSEEDLTPRAVKQFRVPLITAGTVMVSFKLTVGRVAIAANDMHSNEAIAHLVENNETPVASVFTYCFMKDFDYDTLSSTSSIATAVNSKSIKAIEMIVPDSATHSEFVAIVQPLFDRILCNLRETETLSATRDLLLPKLMSGEIRLAEAEKAVEAVA